MKFRALIVDAIREIYARKVILGIILIEAIILVITSLVLFGDGMQAEYSLLREGIIGGDRPSQLVAIPDSGSSAPQAPNADDTLLLGLGQQPDSLDSVKPVSRERSHVFNDTTASKSVAQSNDGVNRGLEEKVRGQMGSFPAITTLAMLFLGLFATAGLVPSMMEKGTVDLLLSKPLRRSTLLLGRASGGMLALVVNHLLFVGALWLIFGLASGVWLPGFLIVAGVVPLFTFAVVYSGVLYLSILTESWVLPVSLAYLHIMILSALLGARETTLYDWVDGEFFHRLFDGLYYVLPQTGDLGAMTMETIYTSSLMSWEPFIQGGIFMAVMIALSLRAFGRKEF